MADFTTHIRLPKALRILQISSAQSFGGGERHLADLTNSLIARGHDLYIAVRPTSPLPGRVNELAAENVRILPLRNALDVKSANELARFAKQHKLDIIHAHMARDYSLAAYATRRNSSARLIITRHVLFSLNRLYGRVLSRAERVIAVSEAVANQLRSQNLVDNSRLSVVRNGIDVARYQQTQNNVDRRDLRHSCGFPEDSLMVGSVGQLNPIKGHDVFLQAAAVVVKTFPKARFVIAGGDSSLRGETLAMLRQLIAELNLDHHVRLLGEIDDIAPLLAGLDVFVSASKAESFGLAMVEALASCVPVVATNTEGAREIVKEGETGLLVAIGQPDSLAKSVKELLAHPELRTRMGQRGQQDAQERFQLKHMVDAIERIYEQAANSDTASAS